MKDRQITRDRHGLCAICGEKNTCREWCADVSKSLGNVTAHGIDKPKSESKVVKDKEQFENLYMQRPEPVPKPKTRCSCGGALSKYNTSGKCFYCQ